MFDGWSRQKKVGERMDRIEQIKYWVETSNQDYSTMIHLFESKDYHWSLFVGHLVIEKLLKALYVKNTDSRIPKIHDLLRLAERCNLKLTDEQ